MKVKLSLLAKNMGTTREVAEKLCRWAGYPVQGEMVEMPDEEAEKEPVGYPSGAASLFAAMARG